MVKRDEKVSALENGALLENVSTISSDGVRRRTGGSVPSTEEDTDAEGEKETGPLNPVPAAPAPGTALMETGKFDLVVFLKELYASYKWYLSHYPGM
jgi:hypothetical protein